MTLTADDHDGDVADGFAKGCVGVSCDPSCLLLTVAVAWTIGVPWLISQSSYSHIDPTGDSSCFLESQAPWDTPPVTTAYR